MNRPLTIKSTAAQLRKLPPSAVTGSVSAAVPANPIGVPAPSGLAVGNQTGAAGAPNRSTSVCPECEGTGFFTVGGFHPDDPRRAISWDCDNCDGTGEIDPTCQCGEPLDDDLLCPACEIQYCIEQGVGLVDVEFWRDANGRFGVGA